MSCILQEDCLDNCSRSTFSPGLGRMRSHFYSRDTFVPNWTSRRSAKNSRRLGVARGSIRPMALPVLVYTLQHRCNIPSASSLCTPCRRRRPSLAHVHIMYVHTHARAYICSCVRVCRGGPFRNMSACLLVIISINAWENVGADVTPFNIRESSNVVKSPSRESTQRRCRDVAIFVTTRVTPLKRSYQRDRQRRFVRKKKKMKSH